MICPNSILHQWQQEMEERLILKKNFKVGIYYGLKAAGIQTLFEKNEMEEEIEISSIKKNSQRGKKKDLYPKGVILPFQLASYDVIITSYDVLRTELSFHTASQYDEKKFRKPKLHAVIPSPLSHLLWWRIVIDECQMVESPTKAAQMCLQLATVHRWCVSGTPMQKGIGDL